MNLEHAPPSRYRVEEKNGRLIVHDTQSGAVLGNQFGKQPAARASTSLDPPKARGSALNLVARASNALDTMERAIASPEASGPQSFGDQEQIKRGAIIAVFGVALAIFAIITGAWIGVVVALIVTPVRQAIIDRMLPAIKLYIAEGRWR